MLMSSSLLERLDIPKRFSVFCTSVHIHRRSIHREHYSVFTMDIWICIAPYVKYLTCMRYLCQDACPKHREQPTLSTQALLLSRRKSHPNQPTNQRCDRIGRIPGHQQRPCSLVSASSPARLLQLSTLCCFPGFSLGFSLVCSTAPALPCPRSEHVSTLHHKHNTPI